MERLCFYSLFSFLLQLSFLCVKAADYTPPNKYFINCGSDSDESVSGLTGQTFVGEHRARSYSFSPGKGTAVQDTNATTTQSTLYRTARIYRDPSAYDFHITESGGYFLRLHFYPLSSRPELANALFDVSAFGVSLLPDFSVRNKSDYPVIEEFLLNISKGKFRINFTPKASSLAFINAIEVFLAPGNFTPDHATHITPAGRRGNYSGLVSQALLTLYRINAGGPIIGPEADDLWRHWIPDDDYLVDRSKAEKSVVYSEGLSYRPGGSTKYTAPEAVYRTAKKTLKRDIGEAIFANITWKFEVNKNATHLVRVHFCDTLNPSITAVTFNLYVYGNFNQGISSFLQFEKSAVPFFFDFVVDSDESGFMNISVGPTREFPNQNAFLNGLEIMKLLGATQDRPEKSHVLVVVGPVVGSVALIVILIVVVVLGLRWRKEKKTKKAKPVENQLSTELLYGGGSFYNRANERSDNGSLVPSLNLELRIPYAEILQATENFNPKLVLGSGGFGKVYKGTLNNGVVAAVKRRDPGVEQGVLEFETEITVLSQIYHRHLVRLLGYCDEKSEMILVYQYMEKGTLRDHLCDSNGNSECKLSWKQRLEICIGAAKGLEYLHTGPDKKIIHRDVKSTNILLDEQFVAKVGDFGLSKSNAADQIEVSTIVKGSFGYLDPEYMRNQQLTEKSDVYSFGVVLLEVLCARPAIKDNENLTEWVSMWKSNGQLEKVIDPFLVGKINHESLRKFVETADKCLNDSGTQRPTMPDVVWDLEYALQLELTAGHGATYEDSTTAAFLESLPATRRFPSDNFRVGEDEEALARHDGSDTTAAEVFSQLRIDIAR